MDNFESNLKINSSKLAAQVCCESETAFTGSQLTVCSYGSNVENTIASIIHSKEKSLCQSITIISLPHCKESTKIVKFADALKRELRYYDSLLTDSIVAVEEGEAAKDRGSYYNRAGIVVCSSRVFCMDLLHRRVSSDLVELCVFPFLSSMINDVRDADIANCAFCTEILFRGKDKGYKKSQVKIITDDPCWSSLVIQRHQIGFANFVSELHISDIQLFPRFRLEIMKHFEEISSLKPLKVDCTNIRVNADTLLLDSCLSKILLETLSELKGKESKIEPTVKSTLFKTKPPELNMKSIDGRSNPKFTAPWRDEMNFKALFFSSISSDVVLDVDSRHLDFDLNVYLRTNGPSWRYKELVESLLDLRYLRRRLHHSSKYDFFFALEDILEKRTKFSVNPLEGVPHPEALWTLSSYFNDLVTLTTHRIGSFANPSKTDQNASKFIEISSGDSDGEETGRHTNIALPHHYFSPRVEDNNDVLDFIWQAVCSWNRRLQKESSARIGSTSPVFVIVAEDNKKMDDITHRLLYSKQDYEKLLFNGFLRRYNFRYGTPFISEGGDFRTDANKNSALPDFDENVNQAIGVKDGDVDAIKKRQKAEKSDVFDGDVEEYFSLDDLNNPLDAAVDRNKNERKKPCIYTQYQNCIAADDGVTNVHEILLSQKCFVVDDKEAGSAKQIKASLGLEVLASKSNFSILSISPTLCSELQEGTGGQIPLVLILDGQSWTSSDFLSIFGSGFWSINSLITPEKIQIQRILFAENNLKNMRIMEIMQDFLKSETLKGLKIVLVINDFSKERPHCVSTREKTSFQLLAQTKASLVEVLLADRMAVRQTEIELGLSDSLSSGTSRRVRSTGFASMSVTNNSLSLPLLLVDEREFRSALPFYLYSKGLNVIPLTLSVGDYILSPNVGVERKSLQDFTMSIQSGRIYHQLEALSNRFEIPICLIEFQPLQPFRLTYSTAWKSSTNNKHLSFIYSRIGRIMASYPKVRFMWSRSPAETAIVFAQIKNDFARENPDPANSTYTSYGMDSSSEIVSAATERSLYAKRVLTCFPGINEKNVEGVMRIAGSLAGLASVNMDSLLTVMNEADANLLFNFINSELR